MKTRRGRKASSLVITLFVIVVLSTIVVAFLQSMSVEQKSAKSVANKYRAVLISDSAVRLAMRELYRTTTEGPFSTTFGAESSAPYLFQAKITNSGNAVSFVRYPEFTTLQSPSAFSDASAKFILTNSYVIADYENGQSINRTLSRPSDIFININASGKLYPNGQIGITASGSAVVVPVNWIYFRDKDNAVIGRYAYWVDDESSKIDLRYAGNTNAAGNHYRGNGANLDEISLQSLTNIGFSAINLPNLYGYKTNATNKFPISEARYGPSKIPDDQWTLVAPYLTTASLQDDRAPDGKRKLNLNAVVNSTNSPAQILSQVDKIKGAITNNIPSFGRRYYQATAPDADDQDKYVTKVAANIRDFIDTDRNATVILDNGSATTNNAPNFVPYELLVDEIPVFGKENVPFLNEYVRVMRVVSPASASDTAPSSNLRNLTVRAAHYIELFNISSQPITYSDLGPNPFIGLGNRTSWVNNGAGGAPNTLRPVDVRIYLPTDFVIPANSYVVVTTDGPPFMNSQAGYFGPAGRYVVTRRSGDTGGLETPQPGTWQAVDAGGQTLPTGTTYEDYAVSTTKNTSNRYNLQCFGSATPSYADARERIIFGNDNGLFDYNLRIYTVANLYLGYDVRNPQCAVTFIADGNTSSKNAPGDSSSQPRYTRADPRSNSESISLDANTSASWKSGGTVYGDQAAHRSDNFQETLGEYNYRYDPSQTPLARIAWNEYTADAAGNHFVSSTNIYSIGQLGFVYDPARYDSAGYRGAGRTLRIGQSDEPSNNRNNNSSAADDMRWLGGLGSTNLTTNSLLNASRFGDIFRTSDLNQGRINPNAIARGSNNPAIYALMHGFKFSTNTNEGASATLGGQNLQATNLMSAMSASVTNGRPFMGAGDVSRLAIFNSSTSLAGIDMAGVSDAAKEEFFRRTANLMSTESLSFTVVSRAQAGILRKDPVGSGDRFIPSATVTRRTTFQLIPVYPPSAADDRPAPASWTIQISGDRID